MPLPKINIVLKPNGTSIEIDGFPIPHVRRIRTDHIAGQAPVVVLDVVTDKITVACEGVDTEVNVTDVIGAMGLMRKGEPWAS